MAPDRSPSAEVGPGILGDPELEGPPTTGRFPGDVSGHDVAQDPAHASSEWPGPRFITAAGRGYREKFPNRGCFSKKFRSAVLSARNWPVAWFNQPVLVVLGAVEGG